jgi:hypothetical protein
MAEIAHITVEIKKGFLLSYGGNAGRFIVALCLHLGAPASWFWTLKVKPHG